MGGAKRSSADLGFSLVCLWDFNVVRFPSERLGCNRLTSHMLDFSDFIEASHLVDLPLGGVPIPGVMVQLVHRCLELIDF